MILLANVFYGRKVYCFEMPTSALGHEPTSRHVRVMSDMPLKADIHRRGLHVRLVPESEVWVHPAAKVRLVASARGARFGSRSCRRN